MTINLIDAQARLPELIRGLAPGEEVVITDNERAVAKIIGQTAQPPLTTRPGPGLLKGMITIVSDDDEHLKDFEEYMP